MYAEQVTDMKFFHITRRLHIINQLVIRNCNSYFERAIF